VTAIEESARAAVAADIAVVAQLAAQAIEEMRPLRGGSVWARLEARSTPLAESLLRDLSGENSTVIVGTIDDAIVGYGAIRLLKLHDGAAVGRIGDLYVLPGARGVGVGEAMIGLLTDWARQRGCVGLDSLALPGDRHTKNFFETHNMVARSITVHRSLGLPSEL